MKDKVQDVEGTFRHLPDVQQCHPPRAFPSGILLAGGRRAVLSRYEVRGHGRQKPHSPAPAPMSPSLISLVNLQVKLGCLCKNTLALSEPAESENGGAGEARSEGHDGGSLGRWGGGRSRKTGAEQWCKGPVSHPCRWVPQSPELWNRTLGHPRSSPEASSSL